MNPSVPVIRELKGKLAKLALEILGQHLWSVKIEFSANVCLCSVCTNARNAYRDATGNWPTSEQETQAMKEFGHV